MGHGTERDRDKRRADYDENQTRKRQRRKAPDTTTACNKRTSETAAVTTNIFVKRQNLLDSKTASSSNDAFSVTLRDNDNSGTLTPSQAGDNSLSEKLPSPEQADNSNESIGNDFHTENLRSKGSDDIADTRGCVENSNRPDSIQRLRLHPHSTPKLAARFPHLSRPPE